MTISTNITRDEYTATAGQTVFTYTFKIFESTDLNVYVTPVGQEADDSADIVTPSVVTGVGDEAGGTITIAATTLGDLVTIVSDIAQDREIDYQVNGDFTPPVVNADFDRTVSLVKQLSDEIDRSLKYQQSEQGVSGKTLPAPEALSVLQWKSDLTGLQNFPIPDLTELTDGGDTALHYHSADRARANHTGTQTAATISDFDTEVSNNTDVAAMTTGGDTALHYHSADRARAVHTGTQLAATISDFGTTVSSNADVSASKTITDFLTVTQAVDLDTMESDTATNNAKVTNATHSGDVAGSGVLTIQPGVVDPAHISATGTPGATTYWRGDNVWVTLPTPGSIDDTAYTRAGWDGDTTNAASKNAISDTNYNMVRYLDADTGGVGCLFSGPTGNTANVGNYNFFAGIGAGASNTSGSENIFTSRLVGTANATGSRNICAGHASFQTNIAGSDNLGIGSSTLNQLNHVDAVKNIALGNFSFDGLISGYNCIGLGYGTGDKITTGNNVTCIGTNAGPTTNKSNELYIDNEETDTPLIYGDFSAQIVGIQGNLYVGRQTQINLVGTHNLTVEGGVIGMKEFASSEPGSIPGYGRLYTKSDNKLYFKSGDNVIHEIAYV